MSAGLRHVSGTTLETFAQQLRDVGAPAMRQRLLGAVARELVAEQRGAFDAEAAPGGSPWAPLVRPRLGKKLRRSGALFAGATRPVFRGASFAFALPPYGRYHQDGAPDANLPARPFMALDPLPAATQQRIARALNQTLDAHFR